MLHRHTTNISKLAGTKLSQSRCRTYLKRQPSSIHFLIKIRVKELDIFHSNSKHYRLSCQIGRNQTIQKGYLSTYFLSSAQIISQQDGFDSFEGRNSSLFFWVEEVKIFNSSSEKQIIKQYLKSSMQYSFLYYHEDRLTLQSSQILLEMKIGQVPIVQFFLIFLIVENVNGIISTIALVFLSYFLFSYVPNNTKIFIQYDLLLPLFLVLNIYIFYGANIPHSPFPFLLMFLPYTLFYLILLSSLVTIGCIMSSLWCMDLKVRYLDLLMVCILFWFLLFNFDSESIAFFTGYYIYSLYNA